MASVSRRAFLRLATTAAGLAVLPVGLAAASHRPGQSVDEAALAVSLPPAPRPPNVLLVTIDTLRADQLGSYGHPYVRTPSMDSLARQGARFASHIVQQPQTDPSHASIFTGMYPASDGVRVHMVDKLPDNLDTLATVFKSAGYATAGLFSFFSFDPEYCGFQRGFDVYRDLTQDQPGLLSSRIGVKGRADLTTDAGIAQLRSFGGAPFYMWLHYFDAHYPYQPPGAYANLYDPNYQGPFDGSIASIDDIEQGQLTPTPDDVRHLMSVYQGAITFIDAQLGRLLAELDTLGLTENTILAVTADHGESFGEHTQFEDGVNFFHPHSLYNSEARAPLLLRYPNRIRPGTTVADASQAIDIFPSLLELANLPISAQAQGTSLIPMLDGSATGRQAFSAMPDYSFTSVTQAGWKLIRNNANGEQTLFDLAADPGETHDASTDQPQQQRQLSGALQDWMRRVGISAT